MDQVFVSGAPGTGKSSFIKLLYNENPPNCHNSTLVIAPKEVRIISAAVGKDSVWRKIDHESLEAIIAKGVKLSILRLKPKETLEKSVDLPTKETLDSGSATANGHLNVNQSSFKLTVTQEINEILPYADQSAELYQSHWIYGVDTGGQAAFIDIAPALLQYHSVNIITHKVTVKLEDKANFFFQY